MASIGTWPAWLPVSACRFEPRVNQRSNAAPNDSSEQVLDMLNDRWMVHLTLHGRMHRDAAALEAFLNSFRGQFNTVNLWHFTRPQPRGTLRGTPTLAAGASQGAASIAIQAVAGETLLAGDMVGVDGLLLQAQTDATADGAGVMTLLLNNRLRTALSSGAAVTWNKPVAPFRLLAHSGVNYVPGYAEEVTMTLGEAI